MSGKTVPCDMYENRNLRKQIGCMNGIFQLFDRRNFLTSWHTSSHKHKRLHLGGQHQLGPHNATNAAIDKEMEVQKQKPRISTESSQVSYSSSSCSSTFSSLDYSRTNISEGPFQITAKKEQQPSLAKGPQSPHIRNVVKDSMYREARGVPIKSFKNDEQKVTVMKHIDSPRPLHKSQFEKPNTRSYEESTRIFARDEKLILHRLSYDGRESRYALKTKHKELPRLSLDSKASSVKCSGLDSRLNVLGQESGIHSRTSSIVAKLMGMDDFPDTITTAESNFTMTGPGPGYTFPSNSSTTTKESKEKQTSFSKPTSSRLPMEPAPWKQAQSRKSPTNTQNSPSYSVYAEMEKRITELEFKRSGKDLRALKQILEAMRKTREKLENKRRAPAGLPNQKQLCSSNRITKSAKVTQKVKFSNSTAGREKANELRPKNDDMKEPSRRFSSIEKKTALRNSEPERTLRAPQRTRVENYAMLSSSGQVQKHSSKKVREISSLSKQTKVNKSMFFNLSDDQLSELSSEPRHSSYQGDTASVKSESNNTVASHLEREVTSLASSTNPNCREKQNSISTSKEHMPAVELSVTLMEQPSPVSVLDTTFYIEESPSPVKKISTVFQDESPRADEAEWPLENLNRFAQADPGYKYNQKPQDMLELVHEPRLLKTKPYETAVNHNESEYRILIPDQKYICKILAASGLFKDTSIMPTANQLISLHPINPNIFHVLVDMEEENGALTEKNEWKELNQKMQRRIVFDTVNEILVRKITTAGSFAVGRKRTSPQGIMRELYLEMAHLCGMPYRNLEDEDDGLIRLLTADMKYQSDDWTDYSGEHQGMGLEIERLIFKDLINEVVTGQVEGLHDWTKKHCRQLFT